ncbi:hypothetical protein NLJ89_g7756 [Agrocybe chaxingu]|uniref:Uncharacterized protein n=1 Tax=Agrocybe chaxingu TaxID=84603 RepID=A0A9W8JYL7_9AGAR|nr:hypothetical protein NLJ89_g7756 [Agrocybe chaxingu]
MDSDSTLSNECIYDQISSESIISTGFGSLMSLNSEDLDLTISATPAAAAHANPLTKRTLYISKHDILRTEASGEGEDLVWVIYLTRSAMAAMDVDIYLGTPLVVDHGLKDLGEVEYRFGWRPLPRLDGLVAFVEAQASVPKTTADGITRIHPRICVTAPKERVKISRVHFDFSHKDDSRKVNTTCLCAPSIIRSWFSCCFSSTCHPNSSQKYTHSGDPALVQKCRRSRAPGQALLQRGRYTRPKDFPLLLFDTFIVLHCHVQHRHLPLLHSHVSGFGQHARPSVVGTFCPNPLLELSPQSDEEVPYYPSDSLFTPNLSPNPPPPDRYVGCLLALPNLRHILVSGDIRLLAIAHHRSVVEAQVVDWINNYSLVDVERFLTNGIGSIGCNKTLRRIGVSFMFKTSPSFRQALLSLDLRFPMLQFVYIHVAHVNALHISEMLAYQEHVVLPNIEVFSIGYTTATSPTFVTAKEDTFRYFRIGSIQWTRKSFDTGVWKAEDKIEEIDEDAYPTSIGSANDPSNGTTKYLPEVYFQKVSIPDPASALLSTFTLSSSSPSILLPTFPVSRSTLSFSFHFCQTSVPGFDIVIQFDSHHLCYADSTTLLLQSTQSHKTFQSTVIPASASKRESSSLSSYGNRLKTFVAGKRQRISNPERDFTRDSITYIPCPLAVSRSTMTLINVLP